MAKNTAQFDPLPELDRDSAIPLHFQLYKSISRSIVRQKPLPGAKLPSERKLSEKLSINRTTVRKAYEQMLDAGLAEKRASRNGLFISEKALQKSQRPFPVFGIVLPCRYSEFMAQSNQFGHQYLEGLIDQAVDLGYSIMMVHPPGPSEPPEKADRWIEHTLGRLSGIVHLGDRGQAEDRPLRLILENTTVPQVSISGRTPYEHITSVIGNARVGATAAAEYLFEQGHRRAAYLADLQPPPDSNTLFDYESRTRGDQIVQSLRDCNIQIEPEDIFTTGEDSERIVRSARTLADRCEETRPTAVLCNNDRIACFLINALHDLGLRVPEDISVIGYDGIDMPGAPLPLSTIRMPFYTLATRAMLYLHGNFTDSTQKEQSCISIPTSLTLRDTTSTAPNRYPARREFTTACQALGQRKGGLS